MRFPVSAASLNSTEQRAPVQAATYESIKAKIDRGINRQLEGRKELQDALREMIETKAYLKKYKTIGAFAEHEYGKSRSWVYEQIKEALPEHGDLHNGLSGMDKPKPSVQKVDAVADTINKASLDEVKEEEPEKPAVHSADEAKQPEPKAHTNEHVAKVNLENGKPKQMLMVWREMGESLIGRSINRADELNRQCPNPQFHAKLISYLKSALAVLDDWKDSVK